MFEFNSLKTLRVVKLLSNLKYLYKLRRNKAYYKKYAIKQKVWQDISYKSITKHDGELPWLDQPIDEQKIKNHPSFALFSKDLQEQLLLWKERGCIKLTDFFNVERLDEVERSILEDLPEKKKKEYFDNRLLNLYKSNKKIDSLFRDQELLKILSFILGKEIAPYQTTNFYKSGSQGAHSDSVHLTTEPLGYLIGVWVALEDIQSGSGEFFYYPGGHKLKYLLNDDYKEKTILFVPEKKINKRYEEKVAEIIADHHLVQETYLPKKGDIMIWHANLLHGSLPKKDSSLSRKSLIMHYFAEDVLCYHEMMEKPAVVNPK